jgi:Transport and Golgi organisation 2
MCTLSFVPTADGYLAGMNRDELLTRPAARPPEMSTLAGMRVIRPSEPSGGTWIGCNSRGVLLALLNWNRLDHGLPEKRHSRGVVIPQLIWQPDSAAVQVRLGQMQLEGLLPFRLIGIFREEGAVVEWRWDGNRPGRNVYAWKRRHWFSSSLSDASAAEQRGRAFAEGANLPDVGRQKWLRALHTSHVPAAGAYSVCVHRPDAATVSYTEVFCGEDQTSMDYFPGSPCRHRSLADDDTIWVTDRPAG